MPDLNPLGICSFIGPDITSLSIFETDRHLWEPGDAAKIKALLEQAEPEEAKRQASLSETEQRQAQLGQNLADVRQTIKETSEQYRGLLVASMNEVIAMGSDCNSQDLGSRLRGFQDNSDLLVETRNLIEYRLIPGGLLNNLQAWVALREIP